jgi:hypothetical protein
MSLCKCGCGKDAGLYTQSHPERGTIKGTPCEYLNGHNGRRPLSERFWEKVNFKGPLPKHDPSLGRCWLWEGARASSTLGYGIISLDGKLIRSTHVAVYFATGKWPTLDVLHKCDHPPCVRIDHLEQGTKSKNLQDAVKRGLLVNPKGENAPKAKLALVQVENIRKEYAKGTTTHRELAKKYGVNHASIGCIVRGTHWRTPC